VNAVQLTWLRRIAFYGNISGQNRIRKKVTSYGSDDTDERGGNIKFFMIAGPYISMSK